MSLPPNKVVMQEVTDPVEITRAQLRHARYERNVSWLEAHIKEVYTTHRGKFICVAGEELFVADSPEKVIALADTSHPEDDGKFCRYIYPEKVARVYANQWSLDFM